LGWNNDQTEPWAFTDVGRTASLGVSVKGAIWNRPNDTVGVAGVFNGISGVHQRFLAAGGTGILVGDGRLSYGLEQIVETYYDARIWKTVHGAVDFQYIENPAFNRDRGPVPVIGARLHWEF
jgi:high affinity Mn2+ porin